jgi:hypothetical protein
MIVVGKDEATGAVRRLDCGGARIRSGRIDSKSIEALYGRLTELVRNPKLSYYRVRLEKDVIPHYHELTWEAIYFGTPAEGEITTGGEIVSEDGKQYWTGGKTERITQDSIIELQPRTPHSLKIYDFPGHILGHLLFCPCFDPRSEGRDEFPLIRRGEYPKTEC